jgi:hypothetical protein
MKSTKFINLCILNEALCLEMNFPVFPASMLTCPAARLPAGLKEEQSIFSMNVRLARKSDFNSFSSVLEEKFK